MIPSVSAHGQFYEALLDCSAFVPGELKATCGFITCQGLVLLRLELGLTLI